MKNSNLNFFKIDKQGTYYYGGNQKWWKNENKTISKYGCGVISMCNLETCLRGGLIKKQHQLTETSDREVTVDFSDYINLVNESYQNKYHFTDKAPLNSLGLMPWTMKKGLKTFLEEQNVHSKVKWAPTLRKSMILTYVRHMLENNMPITASYYVFNKKNRLDFYIYDEEKKTMVKDAGCTSHYFNITGMIEVKEELGNATYFIISSWGNKYYVKMEDWLKKVSYFTNILYVKKGTADIDENIETSSESVII